MWRCDFLKYCFVCEDMRVTSQADIALWSTCFHVSRIVLPDEVTVFDNIFS